MKTLMQFRFVVDKSRIELKLSRNYNKMITKRFVDHFVFVVLMNFWKESSLSLINRQELFVKHIV